MELTTTQRIDARSTTMLASAWPHLSAIAERLADDTRGDSERLIRDAWRWANAERSTPSGLLERLAAAGDRVAVEVIATARRPPEHVVPARSGRPIEPGTGPGTVSERAQVAELIVLVLRAQLSPAARFAFVARKAFACPPGRLRRILRSALDGPGRRASAPAPDGRRRIRPAAPLGVTRAFRAAAHSANLADIEDLIGADLVDRPALWRRLSRPVSAARSYQ